MDPEVCPLMMLLVEEADTEPVPEELLVEEMPLLSVLQAYKCSCTISVAASCGGWMSVPVELVEEIPLLPVLQAPNESCAHDVAAGREGWKLPSPGSC